MDALGRAKRWHMGGSAAQIPHARVELELLDAGKALAWAAKYTAARRSGEIERHKMEIASERRKGGGTRELQCIEGLPKQEQEPAKA